jgi:non-lysosomal glucosylceramidase
MSGFEHQVASHMMAEGMVEESLILTRAIHDRYHAKKRSPFNEVECSDHYARAMASYGTYLTACGFTYHGPEMKMGFALKIGADNFKCAFTAAEGWGTYSQVKKGQSFECTFDIKWGKLLLKVVNVEKGGKVVTKDLTPVVEVTPGKPFRITV